MRARKVFVAGSTGATGQVLIPMARAQGLEVVGHVRPKSAATAPSGAAVFELADAAALEQALAQCSTVISLIGTMRKRFSKGDTYESSDIATAVQLSTAAKKAGVDHFILLSAAGTSSGIGAYYQAKLKAEAAVRDSGVRWTIFRPSSFIGGGHRAPPLMATLTRVLGLDGMRPITLEQLSTALLRCAKARAPLDTVVEGAALWTLVNG
jgi:uncharacterized protein YbjT (DUF2867 family)